METRPPTLIQLLVAVAFALSCFALLLFLWITFGGPTPLKPEGYRFEVPFDEATQLALESDVRISGVSVGKVKDIELGDQGLAVATIEMDEDYAPVPANTRAILRQKTLLGETYVELTPGKHSPLLAEGGTLPAGQVSDAVQLDEIFRTFDEPTRLAFQRWMQEAALAFRGRGADLSAAIGNLEPFAAEANRVLRILDTQRLAVRRLVRNTGEVFEALSERRGQLQGLIRNTDAVFSTTARRNRDLQETFIALPTFLDESRLTLDRLEGFAQDTDPLVQQLRPAARELSPTLIATARLAPELRDFFIGLRPAVAASKDGFPALRKLLGDDLPPLLGELEPFVSDLVPILEAARRYRHEITAFLGNSAAATNAFNRPAEGGNRIFHYLRTTAPLGPEALAAYPRRLTAGRTNPYLKPLGFRNLKSGLESFETRQCTSGITANLDPADAGAFPGDLFERIKRYAFAEQLNSDSLPTPACKKQGKYESIGGMFPEFTDYLHVRELP